jgi:Protein of unknown function (DUF2958)
VCEHGAHSPSILIKEDINMDANNTDHQNATGNTSSSTQADDLEGENLDAEDLAAEVAALDIKAQVAKRLEGHRLYSQENTKFPMQTVYAKLYSAFGHGTWYITEYHPVRGMAFGYVMDLGDDEWGYIDMNELIAVRHPTGLPAICLDAKFEPRVFHEVRAMHVPHRPIQVVVFHD